MKMLFLIVLLLIIFPKTVNAVRLNEVYPAPPSGEEEWIELYNEEATESSLNGFSLTDEKNNNLSFTQSSVPAHGYIVVTSTNILNNDGDTVTLKNSEGTVIGSMSYSANPGSGKSYQYCNGWQMGEPPTREAENTSCAIPATPTEPMNEIPTVTPTATPTIDPPSPTRIPISNISINEIMGNPETGTNEWVELYNNNDFSVELNSWHLDDEEESGSSAKKFTLTIAAKSYGVIELSSAMINNSGDTLRLLDEQKRIVNEIEYEEVEKNTTWSRSLTNINLFCRQSPTRSAENKICVSSVSLTSSPTITPGVQTSPTPTHKLAATITDTIDEEYTPFTNKNKPGKKNVKNTATQSAVLGITEHNKSSTNTITVLLFTAAFFSVLTIVSMVLKMKNSLRS